MLSRDTYCCEAFSSYCILWIYSATQGYNVVLCCIMIKVAVEGCILLFKGGGEGHIGVRIGGDMEFNNRWNVFAHNECLKLSSTISLSTIVTDLSFLDYSFVKTLPQGLLCVYI